MHKLPAPLTKQKNTTLLCGADALDASVRPLRVLSLGAGVQSSALALMAAQGEIDMPDCAIFADTQSEPGSVYRWLDWLEKQLPFPVHRVTKGNLGDESLKVIQSKSGNYRHNHSPPAWIIDPEGRIGICQRHCTSNFKITPIIQELRRIGGKKTGVEQYIGISIDESVRMKPARDKWITNRWPLIERRMSRRDCIAWMESHGYPKPPRSSCVFCPYHSNDEWKRLLNEEPEDFNRAVQWEKEFQHTMTQVTGFRGRPFLHRSCVPLGEIDFNAVSPQGDMFGNECEGMCGV